MKSLSLEVVKLWKSCAPNRSIYPKLHHLTDYGSLTEFYGPLIHFSTLRYERKHMTFKNWSQIMFNYRNATQTFATRHQAMQTVRIDTDNILAVDYFSNKSNGRFDILHSLPSNENEPISKVLAKERPYPLGKYALKIKHPRLNLWVRPLKYFLIGKKMLIKGDLYEEVNNFDDNVIINLKKKYSSPKYVYMEIVEHRLSYLLKHGEEFQVIKGIL